MIAKGDSETTQGPNEKARSQEPRQRPFAAFLVIVLAITSLLIFAYALPSFFNLFNQGPDCGTSSSLPGSSHFTIIIDQAGYNDSRNHTEPWPKINVTVGQRVTIHVWNNSTVEPHGLAITHYFEQTVALQPGQSCDANFTASQTGIFQIYSTITDTTEAFEHAQLNVN